MSAVFQSTVSIQQAFGVPGEIWNDAPWVVQPWTLNSSGTPNIVGATAYTITSQGYAEAGSGGDFGFAGILCSPKDYALFGTSGVPLNPTLTLPDQSQAALLTQGFMVVTLPGAAAIGDYVIFNNTTGALSTMSPGDTITDGYSFANAVVVLYTVAGAGLAVISVNPIVYPYPAPGDFSMSQRSNDLTPPKESKKHASK